MSALYPHTQTSAGLSKTRAAMVGAEACLEPGPNPQDFKFEREDWTSFRTVEGLQQKAGVARGLLRRLVLKELADNGLDAGADVTVGRLVEGGYFVEDNGPGIGGSPDAIARMFSVNRPMVSSKLVRLPTRGALGNGLRVISGAVLASNGSLTVITRNRRITLRPETTGTTTVVEVTDVDHPVGTRIEISLGHTIEADDLDLAWAEAACETGAAGTTYKGETSPLWYDAAHFHELILASGDRPLRELIAKFDGCSGAKAGTIMAKAGLGRSLCSSIDRQQATRLLEVARHHARPVKPERLGIVGVDLYPDRYYAIERDTVSIGSASPEAEIPFVIETWIERSGPKSDASLVALVNRTPITREINAYRSSRAKDKLYLMGCGLSHYIDIPAKGSFHICLNLTTPFCEITSDGKAPNLEPFAPWIGAAISKAIGKAHRAAPKENVKVTIKDVVLDNLDAAVAKTSGDGAYEFNSRQVFYVLRDLVQKATGKELQEPTFQGIITEYESENGEIPGMYREPRGSLLHPHSDAGPMPLGTLSVRDYGRPIWTFNKILYLEKEGFTQALQAVGWLERHDCAILSSKGYTTRAARDLVDKLAEHDEPVTVFCVHDADAFGTMIFQTFQEETKARGARKVDIVNLGLEPAEAQFMGLPAEVLESGKRNKPVAGYVAPQWRTWLQTNRVELNAMSMPAFIAWLDRKMAKFGNGKLIPPEDVLTEDLDNRIEHKIREAVRERILRDAGFEDQVAATLDMIERPDSGDLIRGIEVLLEEEQERSWRDHIESVATGIMVRQMGGAK